MVETLTDERLELRRPPGEGWWGGAVADGQAMPFGSAAHRRDLASIGRDRRRRDRGREPVGAAAGLQRGPLRVVGAPVRLRLRRER